MSIKTRCSSCRTPMLVSMGLLCDVQCPSCEKVVCEDCLNADMQRCQLCLADEPEEEDVDDLKLVKDAFPGMDELVLRQRKVLEPLGDCIVFKAVDADRTAAGLYVPDKAETMKKAIVVAVGPGKQLDDGTRRPMHVRVGDHILLWIDAPTPGGATHTGETLYMCREEHVATRVVMAPPAEGDA